MDSVGEEFENSPIAEHSFCNSAAKRADMRRGFFSCGDGIHCDVDGYGWKERTAHTDRTAIRIFKQNLAKEPLFDAFFSRTEELFAAAMGTTREDLRMRSSFVHGKILESLPAGSQLIWA